MKIEYRIKTSNDEIKRFAVLLDDDTGLLHSAGPVGDADAKAVRDQPAADWTRLAFQQCADCPWSGRQTEHCPAALALQPIIDFAQTLMSYDKVKVAVITERRTVTKSTDAQQVLGSLFGLLLASSGCPRTAPLRPMARFHLPFADARETVYRVISTYLFAQHHRRRRGLPIDSTYAGLQQIYECLEEVNRGLAKRLRAALTTDSGANAIVVLDNFAKHTLLNMEDEFEQFTGLFDSYWHAEAEAPPMAAE